MKEQDGPASLFITEQTVMTLLEFSIDDKRPVADEILWPGGQPILWVGIAAVDPRTIHVSSPMASRFDRVTHSSDRPADATANRGNREPRTALGTNRAAIPFEGGNSECPQS
jgi:hypothetical protein